MSFFPSADPDDEQTPYAEGQPWDRQNTTSYTQQARDDLFDFGPAYATTTHGLPHTQATAWAPSFDQPQGLGLKYSTDGFAHYPGSTTFSQPAATSFTWPADFTPTHTPVVPSRCFRRDSCSDDVCDPPSTVQPSQLWEPFNPATDSTLVRDFSPERSEYSTSSFHSTASSPFVQPESYGAQVGTPLVKVESEPVVSDSLLFRDIPALQDSQAIATHNFATTAATTEQGLSPGFLFASASDAGDVKPSLRPGFRRAYSAADTDEVQYQGRRKRSLTRPENASCSCEVCGKLFQRCYNLKAHMETHDANRSMPNKCRFPGCGKRFVRRTDLTRHNESVHVRSRPFACARCHNTFARKDTLQRHLDDGCPMRAEMKRRPVKQSRSDSSPTMKKEIMPRTPESQATLSPAAIERLRRS